MNMPKKKKPAPPADYALMTMVLVNSMREMEAAFKEVSCVVKAMAKDCQVKYVSKG